MPLKTQRQVKDKRSKQKKQQDFLMKLADYASVNRTCRVTKIAPSTFRQWLKTDASFSTRYAEACKAALQSLEDEAVRRAFEGAPKPVYYQGKKIGTIREFSDTLLMALLKAKAPGNYKDKPALGETATDAAEEKPKPTTVFKWGDREIVI